MANEVDTVAQWLLDHKNEAGSQEYVEMAKRFRALDAQTPADSQPTARRDPYSASDTVGRIGTNALLGIPDLAVGATNALRRYAGTPEDKYPSAMLRSALGIQERPSNAGITRSLSEDAVSALFGGGGVGAIKAIQAAPTIGKAVWPAVKSLLAQTVAPTVVSQIGGEAGKIGAEMAGLDPQTGALAGSIIGGHATGAAPQAYDKYSHNWYAARAKPDAGNIDMAMERMGGRATPGMLGNSRIQDLERGLGSSSGGHELVEGPRQAAHDVIGAALERAAAERGRTAESPGTTTSEVVTPGTIGDRVKTIAADTAERLRQGSDDAQTRLTERVGRDTPVPLRPLLQTGERVLEPGSGLGPTDRINIEHRLGPALERLLLRDTNEPGDPAIMFNPDTGRPTTESPMIGHNGGPRMTPRGTVDRGSPAAPYADVKGYRTELGQSIDNPSTGRLGPAAQLYAPTTEAMRVTAERRGVPRQDFENAMERTRQVETETPDSLGGPVGDYNTLADIANKKSLDAYQFLKEGEQNAADLGTIEATQHPQVPGLMGDILKQIGQEGINNPNLGAAGPRQTATRLENLHPESREILYGDQAPAMEDVTTGARAYNYPTSQTGLNQATGSAADRSSKAINLGTTLGHLGGGGIGGLVGGAVSMFGPAFVNRLRAQGLNSPETLNALRGGEAPPTANIADLAAAMTAAAQAAKERQSIPLPPITVEP